MRISIGMVRLTAAVVTVVWGCGLPSADSDGGISSETVREPDTESADETENGSSREGRTDRDTETEKATETQAGADDDGTMSDSESGTQTDTDTDSDPDGGAPDVGFFTIRIDYRYDTAGAFVPLARETMEAAADVWSGLIADDFENVPEGTMLRCRHPERIDEPGITFDVDYEIEDLVVFVGFTDIDGLRGNQASTSLSFTEEVSDDGLLERLRERFYGAKFEPWIAQVSFDSAEPWFYDITPSPGESVPEDEHDFLSTALHELGHVLGIGNSDAFQSLVVDGHFEGPRAQEVYGGPVPLAPDGVHVDPSVLSDGEEVLMDTGNRDGVRKWPTRLDVAILEDIGYTIID